MSREAYISWLFEIATGWLGWSPAEAYAATIAEIRLAHRGRISLLKAIFGGKSDEDDRDPPRRPVECGTMAALFRRRAGTR
jgi:hypothetical protein